jgi:hypothetical protein
MSSGYVVVPRCLVTFDGASCAEFAGFMRIHMRDLCLWGFLSGKVPCVPHPVALVAPTPLTPPVLASDADKAAAKTTDAAAMDAYDHQLSDYSAALATCHDDLSSYTHCCDEDARVATVLTSSVLP